MRYNPLSSGFYKNSRNSFMNKMKKNSLAVFNSNDIYPISADSMMPFKQHSDIFYLTGIDQEETILLLFPDAPDKINREIIFVKETNEHIAVWEGPKLSVNDTKKLSGISNVLWIKNFDKIFSLLCAQCENIYWNTNEHYRADYETETREERFIKKYNIKFPAHKPNKSNPILQELRSVKSKEEIDQIKNACDITEKGFRRVLKFLKPNVWEYEIQAEFIHEFLINKSNGFAYEPIIATGTNANILHYTKNSCKCLSDELVLMDVAAEYGNYSSDMTRALPVSGRFNKRQKLIYNAVLNVKNEATKLLKPGVNLTDFHENVGEIMTSELIKLGLLNITDVKNQKRDKPLYKKYFMHGTSHHLGLDTHDYGLIDKKIKANMVFTVEPGIYIPKEGIGIRLEDVVVVKENRDPLNLMKSIPIEIEEIEDLMNN